MLRQRLFKIIDCSHAPPLASPNLGACRTNAHHTRPSQVMSRIFCKHGNSNLLKILDITCESCNTY